MAAVDLYPQNSTIIDQFHFIASDVFVFQYSRYSSIVRPILAVSIIHAQLSSKHWHKIKLLRNLQFKGNNLWDTLCIIINVMTAFYVVN